MTRQPTRRNGWWRRTLTSPSGIPFSSSTTSHSAETAQNQSCRKPERTLVPGVDPSPGLASFLRFFKITRNLYLVRRVYEESFPLARAIAIFVRLGSAFRRPRLLPDVSIKAPELRVRHRKLRIEGNRALKKRNPSGASAR